MTDLSLATIAITLFLIMDPIGNTSAYLSLTKHTSAERIKKVIVREMLIALGVMMTFNYIGEFIFDFLELKEESVRLASGVILFLIAIKILFPGPNSMRANLPTGESFIFPLAIPLIAGPSLLATIMLYAHMESSQSLMLSAISLAWLAAITVLLLAKQLDKLLSKNGLVACERLLAMLLVMISIQRLLEGVQQVIQTRH